MFTGFLSSSRYFKATELKEPNISQRITFSKEIMNLKDDLLMIYLSIFDFVIIIKTLSSNHSHYLYKTLSLQSHQRSVIMKR